MAKKKHSAVVKKNILSTSGASFHLTLSSLILFAFLIVGIVMGIYYLNQPQDIRSQAANEKCGRFGQKCCGDGPPRIGTCKNDLQCINKVCLKHRGLYNFEEESRYGAEIVFSSQNIGVEDPKGGENLPYDAEYIIYCAFGEPGYGSYTRLETNPWRKVTFTCRYPEKDGTYEARLIVNWVSYTSDNGVVREEIDKFSKKININYSTNVTPTATPTPKPINTPTSTPKLPTPTPTVAKKPNGSDCTSASQCQSGICKSCPDQGSKCRPNGYICPL